MAIDLTTPIPVADTEYQGITNIEFAFPHFVDTVNGNAMKLDKVKVVVIFEVTTWAGNGDILSKRRENAFFNDWPAGFKTNVKDVYAALENYALAQGYMQAGTPEDL